MPSLRCISVHVCFFLEFWKSSGSGLSTSGRNLPKTGSRWCTNRVSINHYNKWLTVTHWFTSNRLTNRKVSKRVTSLSITGARDGMLLKRGRDNGQFLNRRFVLSEREGTLKYYTKVDVSSTHGSYTVQRPAEFASSIRVDLFPKEFHSSNTMAICKWYDVLLY